MKTINYFRLLLSLALVAAASSVLAHAADDSPKEAAKDPKQAINQQISDAANAYTALQSSASSAVPDWVVSQAKGVIIINRWAGALGVGATGGYGIGLKKTANGRFSAPAFYTLAGASLGLQVGGNKTQTVAFLMSDKALQTLTDSKFIWSGNVRAVAGSHSASDSSANNIADVILYQQSSGLDIGAAINGTKLALDDDSNHKYYDNPTITPTEIFNGRVAMPDPAKPLVELLNKQAGFLVPPAPINPQK